MKLDFIRKPELDINDTRTYQTSEETPINFCFVGPRGVGKTSLLASMYHQIKQNGINGVFIDEHSPDGEVTGDRLSDAYQDMLDMIEDTQIGEIIPLLLGLKGNIEAKAYNFIGTHTIEDRDVFRLSKFKRFRFAFRFTDMPGGWYTDKGSHRDEAKDYLLNSVASFLAIDTPALMKGEATCNRNNHVNRIEDWYRSAADILGANKHTVIIVLSRCEKFWGQKNQMIDNLNKYYKSLINTLKEKGVEVYVTWIKTLGGLEFSHYEKSTDATGQRIDKARFLRVGEYSPENCATPLQLAIERGLVRAADNITTSMWDVIGMGINQLAKDAAQAMANEIKEKLHAGDDNTFQKL